MWGELKQRGSQTREGTVQGNDLNNCTSFCLNFKGFRFEFELDFKNEYLRIFQYVH
jgi:hypothetical protein